MSKLIKFETKWSNTTFNIADGIKNSWPHKVPSQIILKHLNKYFEGTIWSLPPPCAVCSCQIYDTEVTSIIINDSVSPLPHHLNLLLIADLFIIKNCILQSNSAEFEFDHKNMDGLMLYKPAVHGLTDGNVRLDICNAVFFLSAEGYYAQICFS